MALDDLLRRIEKNIVISRRDFLNTIAIIAGVSATGLYGLIETAEATTRSRLSRKVRKIRLDYSKVPTPKLGYISLYREPNMKALELSGNDTDIGRVQRVIRWRNITRAVENRYGIPRDYLTAMACVESEGNPVQPNQLGDGGLGLIHMQPYMAARYGLRLITDSKKLRDFRQGGKINRAIELHNGDLKDLIALDDRFHPIKNLDAASRMLADHFQNTHSWNRALERYAGRRNYDGRVGYYANKIHSTKFMARVREDFKIRNTGILIVGRPIDFDRYITIFSRLNYNYGLQAYLDLPRLPVI